MIKEVAIIGLGPAGIKLSMLLKDANIDFMVFESYMPGGKVNIAPRVDNYPYHEPIAGPDLSFELFSKFSEDGCSFVAEKVLEIKKNNDVFSIKTSSSMYDAKIVVVCSGTEEKKLNLDKEELLFGHGLSYCAICDGHFVKNKTAMVVAEDKYAISEALYLLDICEKVIIVTSSDVLKGEKRRLDALKKYDNLEIICSRKVIELLGDERLTGVKLDDGRTINIDGLFPLVGYIPNTSFLPSKLLDSTGFVKTDKNYETSLTNLFAIGDVTTRELKQIYLAEIDASKVFEVIKERLK